MRLHILSDVHLELAPFAAAAVEADVVVLAGDVHQGYDGLQWIRASFPDKPVVYVLGNHEFYGHTLPSLTRGLQAQSSGTNVHVLENSCVRVDDVIFLGATLWTDLELNGNVEESEAVAFNWMTDYQVIYTEPKRWRLHTSHTRRIHAESVRWLREQLDACQSDKIVIVTHHAPSPQSIPPRFAGSRLNPAFASNLEPLIAESRAKLWIHGHIHSSSDYRVGETRVLANPRGYPHEVEHGFNPALVVEV